MKIYLKMHNGLWMLVSNKIEQTTISKKKRVTRYILAGFSIDNPPLLSSNEFVVVPAGIVNKVISKLLDVESDIVAIIEPYDADDYVIKVPRGGKTIVEAILNEVLSRRRKKTSAQSTEVS